MDGAMDELERFKRDINLSEYAASRGYQLDRRESSRNSVVMRHPVSDDKIVVSRAERGGHWIYFSIRDARDNGTIVDFVQHRDRCSLPDACRELSEWLGVDRPHVAPDSYRASVSVRAVDRDAAHRAYDAAWPVADSRYLNSRGIRTATITDPRFLGTFRADGLGRILFPHHDDAGFGGFESKGRGWTSFAAGGVKALWSSNILPDDRRLVLVESAIDALSHHQLHPDARTRYASTAGTISEHQRRVIAAVITRLPAGCAIVLAFDRDAGGEELARQLRELAPGRTERITSPIGNDWNDCLKVHEREFIDAISRRSGPCMSR
jgi:hypothetical protein